MKIRTQLVLACFLLSVLPLSVIVVYSYQSSRTALESATRHEADAMARQMDRRLATIRGDLQQRLAEVSALPMQRGAAGRTPDVGNILMTMGDAASLVDSLEIQPLRADLVRDAAARTNDNAPPDAAEPSSPATPPAPPAEVAETDDAPDADPSDAPEPIVIDIPSPPRMPRFTLTPEQHALIAQISMLGASLGQSAQTLTPEQRSSAEQKIRQLQKDLDGSLKMTQGAWKEQFESAQRQRVAYFQARQQQRAAAAPPAPSAPDAAVVVKRKLSDAEKAQFRSRENQAALLFGQKFHVALRNDGAIVGHITAQVSTPEVIKRVLGVRVDDGDELTFAADRDNNIYTRTPAERQTLDRLGITERVLKNRPLNDVKDWIVVMTRDPQSGLRVGVARPVGDNLEELRNAAAKNFGYGMALIFVALIGIVPIANHMTRDVKLVTQGAERVAHGDLMTRLPVKSNNEIGQLAVAFNRMAQDLSLQQQTIVEQERTRKEQELQQRLLEVEYARKSVDLEEARRFQLSMLPKSVPAHELYDIAVFTLTAAEVGGDYYDFHIAPNDVLSATIGDATGHGAKAGTMVTVIKALFAGYTPDITPAEFLRDAAEKVKRMDLGRMAMALLVARFTGRRLTVSSAGMPPAYIHRAGGGTIEEAARGATPLGTLGADYSDVTIDLAPGDTVLLMTDGFPELENAAGQQLGYAAAIERFADAAKGETADDVIAALSASAAAWNGERPPNDDVTFVVIRAKAA